MCSLRALERSSHSYSDLARQWEAHHRIILLNSAAILLSSPSLPPLTSCLYFSIARFTIRVRFHAWLFSIRHVHRSSSYCKKIHWFSSDIVYSRRIERNIRARVVVLEYKMSNSDRRIYAHVKLVQNMQNMAARSDAYIRGPRRDGIRKWIYDFAITTWNVRATDEYIRIFFTIWELNFCWC